MSFFKELDTIYLTDATNQEIVLATKENGIWICTLCDKNEDVRSKMLLHIRYTHIKCQ